MGYQNTLYVSNFNRNTKAKDLAPVFEKFGQVERIDLPPTRTPRSAPYAFVEFREYKDGEAALNEMNGKPFGEGDEESNLKIEWARSEPYDSRRFRGPPPRRYDDDYGRRGGYRDYPPRRDYGRYDDRRDRDYGRYDDRNDRRGPSPRDYRDDYRRDDYRRDDYRRDDYRRDDYRRDSYRRDERDRRDDRRDERDIRDERRGSDVRDRSPRGRDNLPAADQENRDERSRSPRD